MERMEVVKTVVEKVVKMAMGVVKEVDMILLVHNAHHYCHHHLYNRNRKYHLCTFCIYKEEKEARRHFF